MIAVAQWVASLSAGLLISSQTLRILKTVNEQEPTARITGQVQTAAVISQDSEGPEVLGSEQLSAALQHLMSSDNNSSHVYIDAMHNPSARGKQDYALGSETLNRHENRRSLSFEPAVQA
ncbi:uncharacterized protein Dana_GF14009, isoform B [Drosophila ananassae]|uniref:Uncharacterized protein, isoform B n=1 Tax=Drosophila ananassae TaxID=7217 RepID=A0A0P8XGT1_DROAN|nr:uncharacterized protein LOC6496837 isoform X2 [Drosophila ananassae]KPU74013.1 uncharacterized protein Dana_GF14009, isoform B [Drosophila ananassae]